MGFLTMKEWNRYKSFENPIEALVAGDVSLPSFPVLLQRKKLHQR